MTFTGWYSDFYIPVFRRKVLSFSQTRLKQNLFWNSNIPCKGQFKALTGKLKNQPNPSARRFNHIGPGINLNRKPLAEEKVAPF